MMTVLRPPAAAHDPRITRALAVAAALAATAGVMMLMAGTFGFPPQFTPSPATSATFLGGWILALAATVAAARPPRTDPDAHARRTRMLRIVTLVALLAPFVAGSVAILVRNPGALLACVPSSAFGLWTVQRMQRYRRMPGWLPLAAFGWGATVAVGFAGTVNSAFSRYSYGLLRDATELILSTPQLPNMLLWANVGVFEELGKAAGVAMAYLVLRRHIDGVVSGIVLGAAVGLGFNLSETVLYMTVQDAAFQHWGRQVVGLMAAHTAFSAAAGAGFGVARQLREARLRRYAITAGVLAAATGHFASNTVMNWVAMSKGDWPEFTPLVDIFVLQPLLLAVVQGPLVAMYLVLRRRGLRSHAAGLSEELPAEAHLGLGAITAAEVAVLLRPARRLWLRVIVLRRHGLRAARNLGRLHAAQLDLATERWHRARREVDPWAPDEHSLRVRVWDLKRRQAALMAAPGSPGTPRTTVRAAAVRGIAALVCALAVVIVAPSTAHAACGDLTYQAADEVPAPAGVPDADCAAVAMGGAAAVGATALSATVTLAIAGYVKGAVSADDLAEVLRAVTQASTEPAPADGLDALHGYDAVPEPPQGTHRSMNDPAVEPWLDELTARYPHLSRDGIHGIWQYTTDEGYSQMNRQMRSVGAPAVPALAQRIDAVNVGLSSLPPYRGTTYRGTNLPSYVLDEIRATGILRDLAFSSSSLNPAVAEGFIRPGAPNPVRVTIEGRTGVNVSPFSAARGEAEILFRGGTEFRVTYLRTGPDGVLELGVREV